MNVVVAIILLHRGTHVAVLHRRDRNCWALPGGKVDEGERPEDAVRRELKEELGVVLDEDNHAINAIHHEFLPANEYHEDFLGLYYTVDVDSMWELNNLEPDKHDRVAWVKEEWLKAVDNPHASRAHLLILPGDLRAIDKAVGDFNAMLNWNRFIEPLTSYCATLKDFTIDVESTIECRNPSPTEANAAAQNIINLIERRGA